MALTSPGVEVTVIDQSQYLPTAVSSVPFLLVATAENKSNAAGDAVAPATTAANANKLYQVTSQRDLVALYGNPFFYTTTNGTPIQGYELNEYGLLAAYSLLASTNLCYVLRADIDLASLVGQVARPTGKPTAGAYWLDTTSSTWGINQWNLSTGQFTVQSPIVITDAADVAGSILNTANYGPMPQDYIGNVGDYAVVMVPVVTAPGASATSPTPSNNFTYWYKTPVLANTNNGNGGWVPVGSPEWQLAVAPTILGSSVAGGLSLTTALSPAGANDGVTITITRVDDSGTAIGTSYVYPVDGTSPPAGSVATLGDLVNLFNNAGTAQTFNTAVMADPMDTNGQFAIFSNTDLKIVITGGTSPAAARVAAILGLTPAVTNTSTTVGNVPTTIYAPNSGQPNWRTGGGEVRPSGSVWIKTSATNQGLSLAMSQYNATTSAFVSTPVNTGSNDWEIIYNLDPTGGKNIPAGTLYGQVTADLWNTTTEGGSTASLPNAPVTAFRNANAGPTVVVGATPTIATGDAGKSFYAYVSVPGSASLSSGYLVTLPTFTAPTTGAQAFVTAWTQAQIPYTTAAVNSSGAIVLTHTEGGVIVLDDEFDGLQASQLIANSLVYKAGFQLGTTAGTKQGPMKVSRYVLQETDATHTNINVSGSGTGLSFSIDVYGTEIRGIGGYNQTIITSGITAGTGYSVGDVITTNVTVTLPNVADTLPTAGYGESYLQFVINAVNGSGQPTEIVPFSSIATPVYTVQLSNWIRPDFTAQQVAPTSLPANNTNWYYSVVDQVDIMVNVMGGSGPEWRGYQNCTFGTNGLVLNATGPSGTDPNGPIISATAPTTQSDGTTLVYGDLWIDSSDLENYPLINRWELVNGTAQWVLIDNADQQTENGVVFADARWGSNGSIDPVNDAIPTIKSMLTSNYIDLDAPSPDVYPQGTLLFNTRRSGYNVKQFRSTYFTQANYPGAGAWNNAQPTNINNLPEFSYTWVSVSGLMTNGAPYMGRKAQRAMVVRSLRSAIGTNAEIREEDTFFNLIATPNYPELQPDMVVLNNDRNQTGYIVGDTPLRLADDATSITAWATNAAKASSTGEDGLVTRNTYMGIYYPSGLAVDLSGNQVAVPASHMILRTILYNDTVAYPWFAPAGQRRGIVDNVTNIGYINAKTGEFQVTKNRVQLRDIEYNNFINPIAYFTNVGILNYGNKNSFDSQSALDRTNVARLICYLRTTLQQAVQPFIFEPNDTSTRNQVKSVVQTLLADVLTKRGIYDYLVVCDQTNNTPARIDRNELWIDVAIEPVKAVEFIYIPIRILNTGEIAAL